MSRRQTSLSVIAILLFISISDSTADSSFATAKYRAPEPTANLTNKIYVLFKETQGQNVAAQAVRAVRGGRLENLPSQALRNDPPYSARTMLNEISSETAPVSMARGKLARYAVFGFSNKNNLRAIATALANDPKVEYVAIDTVPDSGLSACAGNFDDPNIEDETEYSKTWGREVMKVDEAWTYARGHTYIIAADAGIDAQHPDLIDFDSTLYYSGGNFHKHLAVDSGGCPDDSNETDDNYVDNTSCSRISDNGESPVPFDGEAIFGLIDEYRVRAMPGDLLDCDTNGSNFNQASFAGHGTHVAGILSANPNASGTKGVCRNCPTTMMRTSWVQQCTSGTQPHTNNTRQEAVVRPSFYSSAAATAFAIEIGAQVVNVSFGGDSVEGFCGSPFANDPWCVVLRYAEDRDVMVFAAAGNDGVDGRIDFPAFHPSVYGIGGIEPGGAIWNEAGCGTNTDADQGAGISFAAPAVGIYSTMYKNMNFLPSACHEKNDGVTGDGYGYCSGTSMSTPFVSAVAGLVRSVNPLSRKAGVFESLKETTDRADLGQGWHEDFGWGTPNAEAAVKDMLGTVGGQQVLNRVTPLFVLYGSNAQDFVYTTKPQVAMAFDINDEWNYGVWPGARRVKGFSFAEAPEYSPVPTPKANAFVFTTHQSPDPAVPLTPIYRMRKIKVHNWNLDNVDSVLVTSESEINSFSWDDYNLEGLEGYIYAPCTPEPSCIPPGAEKLYRAYNFNKDDYAVFPEFKKIDLEGYGYVGYTTVLGYVYPNVDSDSDNLIDGLETVIGTNPSSTDTDSDGCADLSEYSLLGRPTSDPGDGSDCS